METSNNSYYFFIVAHGICCLIMSTVECNVFLLSVCTFGLGMACPSQALTHFVSYPEDDDSNPVLGLAFPTLLD